MEFFYDFGDQWQFDVVLERVDPERMLEKLLCSTATVSRRSSTPFGMKKVGTEGPFSQFLLSP